jgi:hypothetical protein
MTMKSLLVGGLATALAATTIGCATNPTTTTTAPQQETLSVIDQAQVQPTRSVMSIADLKANLPARISEADAATMLVEIDPSKIVTEGNYSVQQRFGRGGIGRGFGSFGRGFGHGGFRGFGRGFYGGYGRYGGFGRYRYLGYGGSYYPYYLNRGYYYPYTLGGYYNYLYPYSGSYYPYTCW